MCAVCRVCAVLSGVFAAAAERYYKVAAEGLRVCERLVKVLREDVAQTVDTDMVPVAKVSRHCRWLVRLWGAGVVVAVCFQVGVFVEGVRGGGCMSGLQV